MSLPNNPTEVTPPSPPHNQNSSPPSRSAKQPYNTKLNLQPHVALNATRTSNSDELEANIFAPTQYYNPRNPDSLRSPAASSTKDLPSGTSSLTGLARYPAVQTPVALPNPNPTSNSNTKHAQAFATARNLLGASIGDQVFSGNFAVANTDNQESSSHSIQAQATTSQTQRITSQTQSISTGTQGFLSDFTVTSSVTQPASSQSAHAQATVNQTQGFPAGFQGFPNNPIILDPQFSRATKSITPKEDSSRAKLGPQLSSQAPPKRTTADLESYRTNTSPPPELSFSEVARPTPPGFLVHVPNTKNSSPSQSQSNFGNALDRNTDLATNTTGNTPYSQSLYSGIFAPSSNRTSRVLNAPASDSQPKTSYRKTVRKPLRSRAPKALIREWGTLPGDEPSYNQEVNSGTVASYLASSRNSSNFPSNQQQISTAQALSETTPQQTRSRPLEDNMNNSQNQAAAGNNGNSAPRLDSDDMTRAQSTTNPTGNESRRNSNSMDFTYATIAPSEYTSPYGNNALLAGSTSAAPIGGNLTGSPPTSQSLVVGNGSNGLRLNHAEFAAANGNIVTASNTTVNPDFQSGASTSVGALSLPNVPHQGMNRPLSNSASSSHPTILPPPVLPPLYGRNSVTRSPQLPAKSLFNAARPSMNPPPPSQSSNVRPTPIVPPVSPASRDATPDEDTDREIVRRPGFEPVSIWPTYPEVMEGYNAVDRRFESAEDLVRLEMSNEQQREEIADENDDAHERLRLLNRARQINSNLKNEVPEFLPVDSPVHSDNRAGPTFQELALGHLSPAVPDSDNPLEWCTFCRFTCDFGISKEVFWLPQEASAGLCDHCQPTNSIDCLGGWSFGQHMELLLFEDPGENEMIPKISRMPGDDDYEETAEEEAEQMEIERVAKEYRVAAPSPYNTTSTIDKSNIEKYRGPQFCRGQNWRQVNVHMARICPDCRNEKLSIIKHHHEKFSLISEETKHNKKGGVLPRDPNDRRCMYCLEYATEKCDGCPLRLCCTCEVYLRVSSTTETMPFFFVVMEVDSKHGTEGMDDGGMGMTLTHTDL
ncbi:hypothetical protein BJ875DRAFT_529012 [Amylocarpus encephaloides]|uniref:Uncharacterized protein n=1 Tax=Amylocarpus encephaloides TaxID=45428 RepID=A0A9P7YKR7_9HELO|nr:hypothetical protein BJ875DRAFT_529012 [Amylocarpus encephaloides]